MDDILNKPLAEITEDPFFRADNFKNEPWYDDFQMYLHIGVCQRSRNTRFRYRKR